MGRTESEFVLIVNQDLASRWTLLDEPFFVYTTTKKISVLRFHIIPVRMVAIKNTNSN
jgi:hypothetical protein